MKSIAERVAAQIAKAEKERAKAAYKASESTRRSQSAKFAADVRADAHMEALLSGKIEPKSARDFAILDRAEFGADFD